MSILPMLTQTGDFYAPATGANGRAGYAETASASGVKIRVEPSGREIRDDTGTVIMSDALIFAPASATVAEQYKIVSGGVSYIVERVDTMRGVNAVSHYELYCRSI